MPSRYLQFRRRFTDHLVTFVAASLSTIVVGALVAIFAYLLMKGAGSVNWAFLTHTPKPVGEIGGGMANAIVGSSIILGIGSVIGIPFGIGAGIYLAEYGRNRLGSLVRFTADVLNGVPSIVIGLVAFSLVVMRQGHFSAFSGGVALAIMMVPMVARTTEEMLLIYTYALSPYDDWHRQAWAGALILVALIVGTIALVRFLFGRSVLREVS